MTDRVCLNCKYWKHWLDRVVNEDCTTQVRLGDDEPGECYWGDGKPFPIAWQHAPSEVTSVSSDQDASGCACFNARD